MHICVRACTRAYACLVHINTQCCHNQLHYIFQAFFSGALYPTPTARGQLVTVNQQPDLPHILLTMVGGLEWAAALLTAAVAAAAGRVGVVRPLVIGGLALDLALTTAAALGHCLVGDMLAASAAWLFMPVGLTPLVIITIAERYIVTAALAQV